MKRYSSSDQDFGTRKTKIVEKQELNRKKAIRDRRYHIVDEDDEEHEYAYLETIVNKGKRYDDR